MEGSREKRWKRVDEWWGIMIGDKGGIIDIPLYIRDGIICRIMTQCGKGRGRGRMEETRCN